MNNESAIQEHLASLSDDELKAAVKEAADDLAKAAAEQPNSDWHEQCFAGLVIYSGEASKRGLMLATVH